MSVQWKVIPAHLLEKTEKKKQNSETDGNDVKADIPASSSCSQGTPGEPGSPDSDEEFYIGPFQFKRRTEEQLKRDYEQYQPQEGAIHSKRIIYGNSDDSTGRTYFKTCNAGPVFDISTDTIRLSEEEVRQKMAETGPSEEKRRKFSLLLNDADEHFKCMYDNAEVKEIYQTVTSYLNNVLIRLGQVHPHFKGRLIPAGSFPEGTKLKYPDEFDFMVELECLTGDCELVYPDINKPGFAKVKSRSQLMSNLHDKDGFLDPILLSEQFRKHLTDVLSTVKTPEKLEFREKFPFTASTIFEGEGSGVSHMRTHGPSTLVCFLWKHRSIFKCLPIDVDMVPAIKLNDWPNSSLFPVTDQTNLGEIKYNHMLSLKMDGYHVVPTISETWQISFARIETGLMNYYSNYDNMLKVYRLCKLMKTFQTDLNNISGVRFLPTYFLKNLFFYECENFPSAKDWTVDKLHERVSNILDTFVTCIDRDNMPGYFIPSHNVMDDKNSTMLCLLVANLYSQVFSDGIYHTPCPMIQETHRCLQKELLIKTMMQMDDSSDDDADDVSGAQRGQSKPDVVTIDFSGNVLKFLNVKETSKDKS